MQPIRAVVKTFLDRIFKLPPVEERVCIKNSVYKRLQVIFPASVSEKDDTYIFYQAMVLCFWESLIVSAALMVWFLQGCSITIGETVIDAWKWFPSAAREGTDIVFVLYSRIQRVVVFGMFLPFFLVKYRWNINPKKYNIYWRTMSDPRSVRYWKRSKPVKMLHIGFVMALFIYVAWTFQDVPDMFYLKVFEIKQSFLKTAIALTLSAWFYVLILASTICSVSVFYRDIGKTPEV